MAISIWDKPAELKLTPIPFEAMMMATQAKDKAYKQNVDKIDAYADAILGYKALPGDDTEYLKQSRETLNNLVSSSVGKVDLTNPTIAREFITKARSIAQDPKLIRNQGYLEHVQKEQDRLSKLRDEKDAIYPSQAYTLNKNLNEYVTPGSGGGDKYNATTFLGGKKGVNLNAEKEPYFNNMPSLKFDNTKKAGDYYYKLTTDGIDWNRLDNQSINAISDYANSDGGRQELSDYNMLLETNPNALLNKKGEIIAPRDYLYNSLARTAMERYGVSVTDNADNALNLGVKDKKDNTILTFDLPLETTENSQRIQPVKINTDGSIVDGTSKNNSIVGNIVNFLKSNIAYAIMPNTTKQIVDNELASNAKNFSKQDAADKMAEGLREKYPVLAIKFPKKENATNPNVTSDKKFDQNAGKLINFVSESMNQNQTVVNKMFVPGVDKIKDIQSQLFTTNTMNQLNMDGADNVKNKVIDELGYPDGITDEALAKSSFSGYGGFSNPGAFVASIPNSKGINKKIIIEPDVTTKQIYSHSRIASQVYKTGKEQTVNDGMFITEYAPEIDNKGYKVLISQYAIDPNAPDKKGKLLDTDDAFNVYAMEHAQWLKHNKLQHK